jgi:hypothetical protein
MTEETQTTPVAHLSEMPDDDFVQTMKLAAWKDNRWSPFMDETIIDRTQEALRDLLASLNVQFSSDTNIDDADWVRAASSLRRRVNARFAQVNARVKEINRAETASNAAYERKWSAFAEKLADAIEQTPGAYVLDEVTVHNGDFTVRQWLAARRLQAAAKLLKVTS